MSQPFDRNATLEIQGDLDEEAGEFWVANPFMMPEEGHNLSAFETNCLFLNSGGKQFLDASFASGADIDADSRSVIAADFDGDSLTDLLVSNVGGGPLRLFSNQIRNAGHLLQLKLEGTRSNRSAIGTRIVVTLNDGRKIVRDLFPFNGFQGQGPVSDSIGIGELKEAASLEILWPSGTVQTFSDVPADRKITVSEDDSELKL